MPIFAYKASDSFGKIAKGNLEAADERSAVARLQDMGYIPIHVSLSGSEPGRWGINLWGTAASIFRRVSGKDVMRFTQDFSALIKAGVPVDRSLSVIVNLTANPAFKSIIQDVLKSVQSGTYLSDAMARHPKAFSGFYISMVRAGEAGGVLDAVLERLGIFLENAQELQDYIQSALVYPAFLVCVGGISVIILMTFVIPKFSVIFSELGASAIPFSTRLLLGFSAVFRRFWWVMPMGIAAIAFLYRQYIHSPSGRLKMDAFKVRAPILAEWVKTVEAARFTRTLGTLIRSGVPILQALDLVTDIIGNRVIAAAMQRIHERVREGEKLSKPLHDAGLFPDLAVQMITVGEETGRLENMLLNVAESYERTIRNRIKQFIGFLEPALILVMGVIVGFIVISMLMAIFSMNEIPF